MKRRVLIVFLSVSAIGVAVYIMLRPPHRSRAHTWDLSQSHDVSLVPWPANAVNTDPSAIFDINGPVIVRFPEGKTFDHYTDVVTFTRHDNWILSVEFILEPKSVEGAYRTATGLAKDWGLDVEPIEAWHKRTFTETYGGPGPSNRCATSRNNLPHPVSIEIVDSYDRAKPWRVWFDFGWTGP